MAIIPVVVLGMALIAPMDLPAEVLHDRELSVSFPKQDTIPLDPDGSEEDDFEEDDFEEDVLEEDGSEGAEPETGEDEQLLPAEDEPAIDSSEPTPEATPTYLRPQNACPQAIEPLVERLLQDLPTYTELVTGRSLELRSNRPSPFGTVILASEPDFEPIELAENPYGDLSEDVQQIFFTTLERQYWQGQPFSLQNYHWLFLAEADKGWYLSQMYSSVGSASGGEFEAPTPPQESSEGIVGQAVTLWLRDCRAGAVFPPEPVETGR
jgi:hypothetical protein